MYAKKYFDIDCLKKTNLQNEIGVYYITRANNIKEEYYNYFDIDKKDMVDMVYLTTNDFDKVIDTNDIEYSYTDNDEIETFLADLMNYEKYKHFLVVLFNSTWNNASGYKIFDNYFDTFYRDYDTDMHYVGGTKGGKAITLIEYSHDKPTGYNSIIVGLTESEYNKLQNYDIEKIIEYGNNFRC